MAGDAQTGPVQWMRELEQDGEYTGPGDNPPGYVGDLYKTNHVGYYDPDTQEWVPVADFYNGRDAAFAVRTCNIHANLVKALEALVEQFEAYESFMGNRWLIRIGLPRDLEIARQLIAKAKGD